MTPATGAAGVRPMRTSVLAAASTAAPASTMPAPHRDVVQLHSSCSLLSGARRNRHAVVTVAARSSGKPAPRVQQCAHFRRLSSGRADSISAAVPATMGAEKLVPTLSLKLSV